MSSNHSENKYNIGFYFCLLLLIVGLVIAFFLIKNHFHTKPSSLSSEDTGAVTSQAEPESTSEEVASTEVVEKSPFIAPEDMSANQKSIYDKFLSIQEQYPDAYAYIDIPGTPVSEPIMQSPDGGDYNYYYLDHCIDGTEGYPGSLFTCAINSQDFLDFNTVIYGHNMKDESMFGSLKHYTDSAYLEEHPTIYIYTEKGLAQYKIFATVFYSDTLITDTFPKYEKDSAGKFLQSLQEVRNFNSWVSDEITVTEDNHIITLSTCVANSPEERFLVCGVLEE